MATKLDFIKQQITTSNVSSLSLTNCFSERYDNYKVVFSMTTVSAEVAIEFRLIDASGNVITDSEYEHSDRFMKSTGSFQNGSDLNKNKWQYVMYGEGSNTGGFVILDIYNPFSSSHQTFKTHRMSSHYMASSTSTMLARHGNGVHKQKESITGIQAYGGSDITDAVLSVYGVDD